jgi:hypothetical protein
MALTAAEALLAAAGRRMLAPRRSTLLARMIAVGVLLEARATLSLLANGKVRGLAFGHLAFRTRQLRANQAAVHRPVVVAVLEGCLLVRRRGKRGVLEWLLGRVSRWGRGHDIIRI